MLHVLHIQTARSKALNASIIMVHLKDQLRVLWTPCPFYNCTCPWLLWSASQNHSQGRKSSYGIQPQSLCNSHSLQCWIAIIWNMSFIWIVPFLINKRHVNYLGQEVCVVHIWIGLVYQNHRLTEVLIVGSCRNFLFI